MNILLLWQSESALKAKVKFSKQSSIALYKTKNAAVASVPRLC